MIHPLHGHHLLRGIDFIPAEWMSLIDFAAELRAEKKEGREVPRLKGRNIALVFEKTSTRIRCSFETAAADQGAHTAFLDPTALQIGYRESVADTARVLGRLFDGIGYCGDEQAKVDTLAELSGMPVWNGLTDDWHPVQILCDALTMREHAGKPLSKVSYAYVGDVRFNTSCSLLVNGALIGADVRIVAPKQPWPDEECIASTKKIAVETDVYITLTESVDEGVAGVDFVHTDIWVSMGEPKEVWDERIASPPAYQVNAEFMAKAAPNAKFMHCLLAFHDRNTTIGEEIFRATGLGELEAANEVFEGPAFIVFDQAENRVHTIKTVTVATLDD